MSLVSTRFWRAGGLARTSALKWPDGISFFKRTIFIMTLVGGYVPQEGQMGFYLRGSLSLWWVGRFLKLGGGPTKERKRNQILGVRSFFVFWFMSLNIRKGL